MEAVKKQMPTVGRLWKKSIPISSLIIPIGLSHSHDEL
jgi:hypothetical protein